MSAPVIAGQRAALVAALGVLGVPMAGALVDYAEVLADAVAAAEEGGPSLDRKTRDAVREMRNAYPALWEFAVAGHHGGGSGAAQASTDAAIEAMQFQPTERAEQGPLPDLIHACCAALPFVEDAETSDVYKPGFAAGQAKMIRAAIERAQRDQAARR